MLTTVLLAKFLGIIFTSFALGLLFNRDHANEVKIIPKNFANNTVVNIKPPLVN
jgi:hypothetical protein